MLLKLIRNLAVGETLAHPVRRKGRRGMLLAAGTVLDLGTLERLARMGVRQAWIERAGTEGVEEFLPVALETTRDDLADRAGESIRDIASTRNPAVAVDAMKTAVNDLVGTAQNSSRTARLVTEVAGGDDESTRHAVSVCHLSLLLGLLLRDHVASERPRLSRIRATDLAPLALSGLLHDIGRIRVPCEENLETPDAATEAAHCLDARTILTRSVPPAVVAAAMQHHRRFDGTGFPTPERRQSASRSDLHVFSRIVAVADHFDRRRSLHPEETRIESLAWMTDPTRRGWFDPTVLAALPVAVPALPPGTSIRLSTGREAVVLRPNEDHPLGPLVREIRPGRTGAEIDLATDPRVHATHQDGRLLPPATALPEVLSDPRRHAA